MSIVPALAIDASNDPASLTHPTWTLPGGRYVRRRVVDWEQQLDLIGPTIEALLRRPDVDPSGPCLEYYRSQKELLVLVPVLEHHRADMSTRRRPPLGDAAIPHAVSATRNRLEIKVPKGRDLSRADRFIEAACTRAGLRVRLKRSAATYPGSVHWHFRKAHETGTLEITLWRRGRRIWLSVHPRRSAPWIPDTIQRLRAAFERRFGKW